MNKEQELQWFWEQCGFRKDTRFDTIYYYPEPSHNWVSLRDFPLDLNNLFKWAVPKVREKLDNMGLFHLLQIWITEITSTDVDPAIALYQVLLKVFKEKPNDK